jgi:hypothetical protein
MWMNPQQLYGLKQCATQWNKKLHSVLTSLGFKRLHSDHSVYIYVKGDTRILLPVWVDEITAASKSKEPLDWVVTELSKHFKLRDLGETSYLLGVEITRNRSTKTIQLSQEQYIAQMLSKYGMATCAPVSYKI